MFFLLSLLIQLNFAQDFSSDFEHPRDLPCFESHGKEICFSTQNRKNLYQVESSELIKNIHQGSQHALNYPVTVSELFIPYESFKKIFQSESRSPIRRFIFNLAKNLSEFKSFDDMFKWVGLHQYPTQFQIENPNYIHEPLNQYQMGATLTQLPNGTGLTVSCAGCHSANLFGVKVMGLSNRFPRANEFFMMGKKVMEKLPSQGFHALVGGPSGDKEIYKTSRLALKSVGLKKPIVLGLDTSLAQVGLSLSKRNPDEYATKNAHYQKHPRPTSLENQIADSKPAVWWNVKYKTRWLSDGSIISGNPIYTNFLWNEIGRGVDLKKLETWLTQNQNVIKELTTYVFHAEAPKFNDFFPGQIDILKAQNGQKLFRKNCMSCHGDYIKGWEKNKLSYEEQIMTTEVHYHSKTPVIDVGTDPGRARGMDAFYQDLNRLKISKTIGTIVEPQKGYVPPPLVGIWSRWPYFHNNSVPRLCDVLTPDSKRPKTFYMGEAISKEKDFDIVCNGYPLNSKTPAHWKKDEFLFDSAKDGLKNTGHSKMLLHEDGTEKFSHLQKIELIQFLQTL
jgi:hypothetical protein